MRTIHKPAYQRWIQRFRWVRSRGGKSTLAKMLASRIDEFRAFATTEGFDPAALGDFARKFSPTGRPTSACQRHVEQRLRYRELRNLGATWQQARNGSCTEFAFARVKRELSGAFRDPGQRERCGGAALPPRHNERIER